MKHPSYKELQDYFESCGDERKIMSLREHFQECDRCSLILSEMAKVDVFFSRKKKVDVSDKTREKVFKNASLLLAKRRIETKEKEIKKIQRKEKYQKILSFPEKLIPLASTFALLIATLILIEIKTTEKKVISYTIISEEAATYYSDYKGYQK